MSGSGREALILTGRNRGFGVATARAVHLKDFSVPSAKGRLRLCNAASNTLLPALGSSFTGDTTFIVGQLGSPTIRNQSTVGDGHVGASVVNTLFKFIFLVKADPLEKS